jgi:hypothetical protein
MSVKAFYRRVPEARLKLPGGPTDAFKVDLPTSMIPCRIKLIPNTRDITMRRGRSFALKALSLPAGRVMGVKAAIAERREP